MPSDPVAWVSDIARAHDLIVLESSLAKFPGSTHWHLRRGGATGTLEVTWWPRTDEFWVSFHSNREADWMRSILDELTPL